MLTDPDNNSVRSSSVMDDLIEIGLKAAELPLRHKVKTWARHTNEKSDVASDLMTALRTLHRALPQDSALRTLSIGSSDEPQFRLLHAASQGGLWLFDADNAALDVVRERLQRQMLAGVHVVEGDFTKELFSPSAAQRTRVDRLGDDLFDLVLVHHALYYCTAKDWADFISTIYETLLRTPGAIHLALMSSTSKEPFTTTELYNHFAGQFFGHRNNQDLLALEPQLSSRPEFASAQFTHRTQAVEFQCDDFFQFMAVVWMILLYPEGHQYSEPQRREITEYVAVNFWLPNRPLKQVQDYLTIYRK